MTCCTIPISMKEKSESKTLMLNSNNSQESSLTTNKCKTNSATGIVAIFLDYILCLHIGAVLGYMSGACIGSLYTNYYLPANCDNWRTISNLRMIPFSFALKGAVIGMIASILFIAVLVVRQSPLKHKKGG